MKRRHWIMHTTLKSNSLIFCKENRSESFAVCRCGNNYVLSTANKIHSHYVKERCVKV